MAAFFVEVSRVKNSAPDLSNLNCQFDSFREAFSYFSDVCESNDIDYEFKGETNTNAGGVGYSYLVRLIVEGVEEPDNLDYCFCGC